MSSFDSSSDFWPLSRIRSSPNSLNIRATWANSGYGTAAVPGLETTRDSAGGQRRSVCRPQVHEPSAPGLLPKYGHQSEWARDSRARQMSRPVFPDPSNAIPSTGTRHFDARGISAAVDSLMCSRWPRSRHTQVVSHDDHGSRLPDPLADVATKPSPPDRGASVEASYGRLRSLGKCESSQLSSISARETFSDGSPERGSDTTGSSCPVPGHSFQPSLVCHAPW